MLSGVTYDGPAYCTVVSPTPAAKHCSRPTRLSPDAGICSVLHMNEESVITAYGCLSGPVIT